MANTYEQFGIRDPFAEINARLQKLGLKPISMGGAPTVPDFAAMYQRPISTPSALETQQAIAKKAGPMYNQLTPEAESGVMEKIGGGLLSGLEMVGRTIDSVTGARAIRGVLGGNFREAWSAGPLGFVSDAIGLTDPKDIVGGRDLMEKAGILEENKPGLDWGDVGGFAAEVLLDPSTYFFGAGLATKGASAATKAGKAFGKVGILDDVLRKATTDDKLLAKLLQGAVSRGDKVAIKTLDDIAKGAAKKGSGIRMGQRQIGRRITADDVLSLDDEITQALASQGKQSLGEVDSLSRSFRGLDGRSVREVLEGSVGGPKKLEDLMANTWRIPGAKKGTTEAMPMTSHWSMGFPTLFTGEKGTKGIRQGLFSNLPEFMSRKQYFPSLDKGFGKNIDAFAGRLDVAGDIMRFGKLSPMRGLATLFNPNLQWNARTAAAQRSILNNISKGERRIKQVNTMLFQSDSTLRSNDFLNKEAYMEKFGMSADQAEEAVSRGAPDFSQLLEGYGVEYIDGVDGNKIRVPVLPTHDIKQAPKIRRVAELNYVQSKTHYNVMTKQLRDTIDLEQGALNTAADKGPDYLERTTREFATEKDTLLRAQREAQEMGAEWQKIIDDLDVLLDVEGGGKNATYSNLVEQAPGVVAGHAKRQGHDNAQDIIVRMKDLSRKFNQGPPEGIARPGSVEGYIQEIEVHDFLKRGTAKKKLTSPRFDTPKGGVHNRNFPDIPESLQKLPGDLGVLDDEGVSLLEKTVSRVMSYAQEAIDIAEASGMDTSELSDTWAMFFPRSIEEPTRSGMMGYIEKAQRNKKLKQRMKDTAIDPRAQKENLNPISRRMGQRRKYLQNIFGGTSTLNHFYTKFGGDEVKRIVGKQVLDDDDLLKLVHKITEDDHWFFAARNKEYADQLIDDGILNKVDFDDAGNPSNLPRDINGKAVQIFPVEYHTYGGVDPPLKQAVYVNKDSESIKELAKSILDKPESLAKGEQLFSNDPIRSMIGYYGDVIKASTAADTILELASDNAYFSMLKHLEDPGGTEGSVHTVAKILADTKLDTLVGKRKFLDRIRSERPEQWEEFMRMWTAPIDTLEEAQQVAIRERRANFPELAEFLKKLDTDPDSIGIEKFDDVRYRTGAGGGDSETYTVVAKEWYVDGELTVGRGDGLPPQGAPDVDPESLARTTRVDPDDLSINKPEGTPEYQIADDPFDDAEHVLGPKPGGYSQEDINWFESNKGRLIAAGEENPDAWLKEMYSERQATPAAEIAPPVNPAAPQIAGITPKSVQPDEILLATDLDETVKSLDELKTLIKAPRPQPDEILTVAEIDKKIELIDYALNRLSIQYTSPPFGRSYSIEELGKLEVAIRDLKILRETYDVDALPPPGTFVGLKPRAIQAMRDVIDDIRRMKIGIKDVVAREQIFYDTRVFIANHTSDAQRKGWLKKELYNKGIGGRLDLKLDWREKYAKHLEYRLETALEKLEKPLLKAPAPVSATQQVDDILTEAKGGAKPADDIVEIDYGESINSPKEVVEINEYDTTRQGMNRQEKDFYDTVKLGRTNPRATFAYVKIYPSTQDAIVKRMQAQADISIKKGYDINAEATNALIEKINSSTKNNKNLANFSIREMQAIWDVTLDKLDGSAPFAGTAGTNARKIHNDVEGLIWAWQLRGGTKNVKPGGIGGPGYLNTKGDFQFLSTKQKQVVRAYQKRLKLDESIPTGNPHTALVDAPAVTKKPTAPIEQPPVTPTVVGPGETLVDQEYAALQKLREGPVGDVNLLDEAGQTAPYSRPDINLEDDILRGGGGPVGGVAGGDTGGKKNGWYVVLDGLEGEHPIEQFAGKHYIPNSVLRNKATYSDGFTMSDALLGNFHMEGEISDDLRRYINSFTKRDITNEFLAVSDWFTDSFKDMATSIWPAFHARNFISGQVNNMFSGAYDPRYSGPKKWIQPIMDAMAIAEGKTITGLMELDVFKAMKGIDTDEQVTQYIVDLAMGHGLIGPGQHLADLDQVATGQVKNFLERVGGPNPIIKEDAASRVLDYPRGMAGRVLDARKLGDEVVGELKGHTLPGFTNSKVVRVAHGYKRMGFQLGNEVEFLNRISPLIAHIRKGLSPEEAILKVKLAQVDYKALTPWEKTFMKRIIPFYTFTRRQVPFVVENMLDPSGSMATTAKTVFRTKRAMEDTNEPVPDYISTNVNLPLHKLGGAAEGQARYITGLGGFLGGLEDVSSLIKPGHGFLDTASRTLSGLFGRGLPVGQALVETATGQSLFHQRPYDDMKSPTAKLLGELSGSDTVPRYPSSKADALLGKLPGYGRAISTARTLADETRKPFFDEGGNFSAMNFLARVAPATLGTRITEVPMDRIKNRLLQNKLEEILARNPNMVKFSQMYIPEDKLGALNEDELAAYMLYKKLGSQAAKASYARRKAAEYSN